MKTINCFIYLSLFATIFVLGFLKETINWKNKKVGNIFGIWLPIILLILFSSFKKIDVGVDTKHYLDFYTNTAPNLTSFNLLLKAKFDFMFSFLSFVFSSMHVPFRIFLLVVYSIIYIPIGLIISKYSISSILSFAIYFGWSFFAFNLSGLRQAISISLCLYSIILFSSKKEWIIKIISIVIFLIGSLFHYSSIAFAVSFPLMSFNFNAKRRSYIFFILISLILFISSPAIYSFIFSFLNINHYIPELKTNVGALFFLYLLLFVFMYFLYLSHPVISFFDLNIGFFLDKHISLNKLIKANNINNKSGEIIKEENLLFVFFIGVIIYSMSAVSNSFVRLAFPFLSTIIIILPNAINKFRTNSLKICLNIFAILSFLFLFYYEYALGNAMDICPTDYLIF